MVSRVLRIENKLGLHARAAAKLVKVASRFQSDVRLTGINGEKETDGKSILGILLMAARQGTDIEVRVSGEDEQATIQAIEDLVRSRFGEEK